MNYLFFDLEEASCRNNIVYVCEFGYVLTDENFNVIEKGNFIINPNIEDYEWDTKVVNDILTRPVYEYKNHPTFDYYYPDILRLLQKADFIFGHTTAGDINGLNQEFARYHFPAFNTAFYDIKEFYKVLNRITYNVALIKMVSALGVENSATNVHDALADAFNTMLCLKQLLVLYKQRLDSLIALCPNAKDETKDFVIASYLEKESKMKKLEEEILALEPESNDIDKEHRINYDKYHVFLDNLKVKGSGILKEKRIAISLNYEHHHYKEMLNLASLLAKEGGKITNDCSKADIFVTYPSNEDTKDYRKELMEKEVQKGKKVEWISLEELLQKLNWTEEELEKMPSPSFDFLFEPDTIIKDRAFRKKIEKINAKKEDDFGTYETNDENKVTMNDLFGDALDHFFDD